MKKILAKLNGVHWGGRVAGLVALCWVLAWAFRFPNVYVAIDLFPKGPWHYPQDSTMVLLLLLFLIYCMGVNQLREATWPPLLVIVLALGLFWPMVEAPGTWQLRHVMSGFGHPDPQCGYVTWPHVFKYGYDTNALGFADAEVPRTKEPDEVRVVVVGDSSTYGVGLEGGKRYTDHVAALLAERGYRNVRVINAGTSGHISTSGARLMARLRDRLQPDLLVISYNNDPRASALHAKVYRDLGPDWVEELRYGVFQIELLHALVKLGFNLTHDAVPHEFGDRIYWDPDRTTEAYRQLFALTPGPDVVLAMPLPKPSAEEYAYRRQLTELAREDGSIVCEAFARWQDEGIREFLDTCHPTLRGHRILADDLLSTLEPMLQQRLAASP